MRSLWFILSLFGFVILISVFLYHYFFIKDLIAIPSSLPSFGHSYPPLYLFSLICAISLIVLSLIGAVGSTLTMENILDNSTRAKIFATVILHPGIHYSELTRRLSLSNSQATWHLALLKKFQLIRSVKTNNYLLFFPNIASIFDEDDTRNYSIVLKSETRNQIFDIIRENYPITQNDIIKSLHISQSTLAYHLAILQQEELIYSKKQGRKKFYYIGNSEKLIS